MTPSSQEVGGKDNGLYQIQLAMLEFDDIPSDPDDESSGTPAATSTNGSQSPNQPVGSALSTVEHGTAVNNFSLGSFSWYALFVLALHVLLYTRVRGRIS